LKHLLVTGGAGFIGSNFVRYWFERHPDDRITVLDALTYAGHLENLEDVKDNPNFAFVQGDIRSADDVAKPVEEADIVVNFAAESHVDRSIAEPEAVLTTNVLGVFTLVEAAKKSGVERFIQISTDEVYGDIAEGSSKETDLLEPSSPYSAGKAGGEQLARAYYRTYGVPVIVTRGSNTYGPYQQPEKLVPLFVSNALEGKQLPVYGDGKQVRDWLHVMDHCSGIETVIQKGAPGGIYNIGGSNEHTNIEITRMIIQVISKSLGGDMMSPPNDLIKYVEDRPGHDRRYSLDSTKLLGLGWKRTHVFETAMPATIRWYMDNQEWWRRIKEDEQHKRFSEEWYANR